MIIFGYRIIPEKEHRGLLNQLSANEGAISQLKLDLETAMREKEEALKQFEEHKGFIIHDYARRGYIIEHVLYTLKHPPQLTQQNWSLEFKPYMDRLEKVARGEYNHE